VIKVLVAYGTRPEVIKLAPVVHELRRRGDVFRTTVCATAQHRQMLDQAHAAFGIEADLDLDLMRPDQSLNALASRTLAALEPVLDEVEPDWVVVQGDTTTAMTVALAAFHRGARVAHVEAGLRTGDLRRPFPEEANRRIIDTVADALFVPTERALRAVLGEGVSEERVFLTGNTVVDALLSVAADIEDEPGADEVLITAHRRESFGEPLKRVFGAVRELARRFPETRFVYPVHRNPNVLGPAHEMLEAIPNLQLHEPFGYPELVRRLRRARLVITDSGGIQEEAPTFGTPVLVVRETTERPEGVEAGIAMVVGTDGERIVSEAARLLTDADAYRSMSCTANPYGDGHAAERIVAILADEPWQPLTFGGSKVSP